MHPLTLKVIYSFLTDARHRTVRYEHPLRRIIDPISFETNFVLRLPIVLRFEVTAVLL
jgi:hypothetical protein